MSEVPCIEYEDYIKIRQQQSMALTPQSLKPFQSCEDNLKSTPVLPMSVPIVALPRPNIFQQNRILLFELQKSKSCIRQIHSIVQHYKNVCKCIIDAIGRVLSEDVATQLRQIVNQCEIQIKNRQKSSQNVQEINGDVLYSEQISNLEQTIYGVLITHQQQLTYGDHEQSRKSIGRQLRTPQKSLNAQTFRQISSKNSSNYCNLNQSQFSQPLVSPRVSTHRNRSPLSLNQNPALNYISKGYEGSSSLNYHNKLNNDKNADRNINCSNQQKDPSTNRSTNTNPPQAPGIYHKKGICNSPMNTKIVRDSNDNYIIPTTIVATGISCQVCWQTFAPKQFVEHASRCKSSKQHTQNNNQSRFQKDSLEYSKMNPNSQYIQVVQDSQPFLSIPSVPSSQFQDTQDLKLQAQSNQHQMMMENLLKIQKEIQQQICMLIYSKQKIDRDKQKRKLQKDLAKVMSVIQQKKKQVANEKTKNKDSKQQQRQKLKYRGKIADRQKQNEKGIIQRQSLNLNSSRCPKIKKSIPTKNKN